MNKINKKPAFSLMEVMIILLIMAVTLAATAPMISRKMSRNVGTAEEPWKFNGASESISFNGEGRDNSTVFIGTDRVGRVVNNATRASLIPLLIRSRIIPPAGARPEPAIAFNTTDRIVRGGNGRYFDDTGDAYFAQNERHALEAAQAAVDNAQAAYDSDPSDANKAALDNANNLLQDAQQVYDALLDSTSDNMSRGFIGFTRHNINGDEVFIPYISNTIPSEGFPGIMLGARLRIHNGGFLGGTIVPDNILDKIIIGHDSDVFSTRDNSRMLPERIIAIGSDNCMRGKDLIFIGRGVDAIHGERQGARNTVLIESGRALAINLNPREANNDALTLRSSIFYVNEDAINTDTRTFTEEEFAEIWQRTNGLSPELRENTRTYMKGATRLRRDLSFTNNNENTNGSNSVGSTTVRFRVPCDITGVGQGLFASGLGHTMLGNIANCGYYRAQDTNLLFNSSFSSVSIGNAVTAAGSNCVAIGNHIVAGFPGIHEPRNNATKAQNHLVWASDNARNNSIAIGFGNGDAIEQSNTDQSNAAIAESAISIGQVARVVLDEEHDAEFGIAIGNTAEVFSAHGIAIGHFTRVFNGSDNSIAIGENARVGDNGPAANSVAIGVNAEANRDNEIVLGQTTNAPRVVIPGDLEIVRDFFFKGQQITVDTPAGYGFTALSDVRLKNLGEKLTSGLEDIKKLEFFNYTFKDDKDQKPHVGVMAQDLQKVFPTSVTEGSDGYLRIRWDEMFYAALNAIKELDRKIIALAQDVKSFFERVDSIELRVAQHQKALDDLKSDFADIDARLKALEE